MCVGRLLGPGVLVKVLPRSSLCLGLALELVGSCELWKVAALLSAAGKKRGPIVAEGADDVFIVISFSLYFL